MKKSSPLLPKRFARTRDRKSTRLNSSHANISYAVFCLKTKKHTSELQSRQYLVCRLLLDIAIKPVSTLGYPRYDNQDAAPATKTSRYKRAICAIRLDQQ